MWKCICIAHIFFFYLLHWTAVPGTVQGPRKIKHYLDEVGAFWTLHSSGGERKLF